MFQSIGERSRPKTRPSLIANDWTKSRTLVSIHSKEEQEFLNNALKTYSNISENAWIGMKYNDKSYQWLDGSDSNYTNWSDDAVRTGDEPCVLMSITRERI